MNEQYEFFWEEDGQKDFAITLTDEDEFSKSPQFILWTDYAKDVDAWINPIHIEMKDKQELETLHNVVKLFMGKINLLQEFIEEIQEN